MPHSPYLLLFSQVLGQVGKVLKVYADGDLRVAFGGQTWTFNPACLSAQPVEVDANLMTAENPTDSGSKASAWTKGLISITPASALPVIHPPFPSFQLCLFNACFHIQVAPVTLISTVTAIPCLLFYLFIFFIIVLARCPFLETFFSVACHDPACWQALVALQTIVISEVLSSLIIMTKSILCMFQHSEWDVHNSVCVCVYVCSDYTAWRDILTHSCGFWAQPWQTH